MRTFSLFPRAGLAAALLLVLVSPTFAAGNRYDARERDARLEARDEEDEGPERDEESAEPVSDAAAPEAASPEPSAAPDAAASEPAPEVAAEPAEPLPPLPDPKTVVVTLGEGQEEGTFALTGAGAEFNVAIPELFARVAIPGEGELALNGRIVVEAAEGEVAGDELVRAACPEFLGEQRAVNLRFINPESGLPPGRYRVEVLENGPAARTIATAVFTTKPAPLPAPGRLRLGLHETDSVPEALACGEQSSRPARLYATLETLDPTTLRLAARIVAEEVEGLPREHVVASPAEPFCELSPAVGRATVLFGLPRLGLPAGRYRIEFREVAPPRRVVKSAVFTTRDPAETEVFDLADPENGGLLESVSGEEGAGLTWAWMTLRPHNTREWSSDDSRASVRLPCDFVISFFKREPAMVAAVEVTPSGTAPAVGRIEVWGSMVSAKDGFQKVAEKTFTESNGEPSTVPLPNALMRFVKIRLVQAQGGEAQLGVRALRVLEGAAAGYQPLRKRLPEVLAWKFQPRHAAQQGLFFLQASGADFQRQNSCMGCHVQSQALMGLTVARKNEYVVSDAVERELADFTVACATPRGDIGRHVAAGDLVSPDLTNTIFGGLALAYTRPGPKTTAELVACARWLAAEQEPEGFVFPDSSHPPVTQGEILHTAHTVTVWAEALAAGGDPTLAQNIARALAWLKDAPTETTQDKVFKVLALVRHGGPAEKKLARQLCQELLAEQRPSGAWHVDPAEEGGVDSPFATGQVLFALREAGYSPNQPSFRRGVQWLLLAQDDNASWQAGDTTSPFASTMWPVIALTGTFSSKADPARLNVTALPRPQPPAPPPPPPVAAAPRTAPPKNIMLVFDCSFSMTEKLRKRTKFEIAKEVLREVIRQLPADTKVGLRLYGHRHGSMTSESRTDTELVVPVGPLKRENLIATIEAAKALGQTPLVLSTLQAAEDLKKVGGGILIVVTDGEESCGGRPRKAGPQLAALGVPLRLEVIGFALTGRRVVDEMTAFTAPTGGRFHTAADGLQLAAALKAAAEPAPVIVPPPPPPPPAPEPEDLPYEVLDGQGLPVAKGSTLGEAPELAAGEYSVELRDGARTAKLGKLKLAEGQTLELRYDPATGRLEYVP